MFRFQCAVGVLLVAALALGRAAGDDTFDLRGPGPQKGQVLVAKTTLTVRDADTVMKAGAESVKLKLTLVATLEEEVTVLEVNGRDVTKCLTRVLKDRVETSGADKELAHTETSALERETIASTRDGQKWTHAIVDGRPTEKQKKQLDDRPEIETDDDLFPKEKVKVGHAWTADAVGINRALGNALVDVKGKLDQKFVRVEELDGEKVAVVESAGKITGKMRDDGAPTLDAAIELKQTAWKSLKTGVVIRVKIEGKISLSGTVKDGDNKTELILTGPISGETTTKWVEKK
ncbi:MAG: hypothetical protein J0I06_25620 [Planctomycetes bacterium]|nr:hypothetical protein [Planctomycetota bacterium]